MTSDTPHKSIRPAHRLDNVSEYWFSHKLAEVARLNAQGRDIISMAIGGPDMPPSAEVIEELCAMARRPDTHSYQNTRSIPELRCAFSRWYKRHYNVSLDPDSEILPLIGSKEGLTHIMLAFLNPGDGVLVPDPGYPTYTSAAAITGAEAIPYRLTESTGWYPDFDKLDSMDLSRVKMMIVNYPHMPTGAQASMELLTQIVEFGRRHGILIVHDNPYSFILNDTPLSILSVPGAKDVAIELNSLSKSHNMAGWRVAMLASNPTFVSWVLRIKSNVDSGQFRPVMLAAVKALDAPDEWYAKLNEAYSRRRAIAERIMTALGCTFEPSQRGLFLWGHIPDSAESSEQLADRVLEQARVFITPGFIFGHGGDRYIRLSLCAPEHMMLRALERIEAAAL
ncbi:MAG: aminotransferase class I/II-fold pyridoxal phosphate-dependent enzyme [Muribaculaceae bacterium]|nr:aminotransferase class I/II-fold pyridoxal phosphate-dependent enzyme [Muribaculaceae bacterium]